MTEQERAAALAFADEIERGNFVVGMHVEDSVMLEPVYETTKSELVALLRRAYARPAPADLREAIIRAIYLALDPKMSDPYDQAVARKARFGGTPTPMVQQAITAADAILSLLPQTQEIDVLADMRETLQRFVDLTPQRAGSFTASDLHLSVRAIAASAIERLDRAAGKEG